jgi:phosphoserine phosphatase RsbU/P
LRVPASIIQAALTGRRELLSMSFDPNPTGPDGMSTIAELELRSAVCVPLVRVGTAADPAAAPARPVDQTIGVLYLDTRADQADLASSARELLQTLAVEASMILENARLLEGERELKRIESELEIAREIQKNLLPRELPATGWLRAAGRGIPSRQVGGDYFDLRQVSPSAWTMVISDVSGKGVSSALLAALLQGVFLTAPSSGLAAEEAMLRINSFLLERTGGEKYATLFLATLEQDGRLRYINAGHGACLLARAEGSVEEFGPTGPPIGMLEEAGYAMEEAHLCDGDKLVLFTDGLTDAEDTEGRPLGTARVRKIARAGARLGPGAIVEALSAALALHTGGAVQKDDITVMVVEYRSERG